jgi:L-lysine 2,3-aminomutase
MEERELFIRVYRFMATRHVLSTIDWRNFEADSVFQLVFPQPGMIRPDVAAAYLSASSEEARQEIVKRYIRETNPHDGKQKLNKPVLRNRSGCAEIVPGSQHKYPQCQLIFDAQTQDCFAFCNYCFRHAQVRGDEDMFVQKDIGQIHEYLMQHPEVTDLLITGGDAGYLTADRFERYIEPILHEPKLLHIKTIRLGTRVLTYDPERILSKEYGRMLQLFRRLNDHGVQLVFMSHFSTPQEVLNPATIGAIRRLRAHGATVKSQSPVMNHISLFTNDRGEVDVERSAQNWIDLGNLLAMLSVGFHSMYCARPTGEHHYFTAPLADINRVFSRVYRSLASINRPSRYITMTSSAGKISLLGTTEVRGEKLFVLKFNEGRNMEWLDRVYLAKFDPRQNTIEKLEPYEGGKHFFQDELREIERNLEASFEEEFGTEEHDQ